jgi:hypothetical protein
VTALLALLALQGAGDPEPLQQRVRRTTVTLFAFETFRLGADLDGAPGEVAMSHSKLSFQLDHVLPSDDSLYVNGGIDWLRYEFSEGAPELFRDVYVRRLEAAFIHPFDEAWSGVAYGSVYSLSEEGADASDALSIGAGAGALYRASPDLTVGGLLRVQSRIEARPLIFPNPYLEWRFAPGFELKTEQRLGYGLILSWEAGPTVSLEPRVLYMVRRFRLDGDPILPEGVVEDERGGLDVTLRWSPDPDLSVALTLGADLWQEFALDDRSGDKVAEFETGMQPYAAFSFQLAF